MPGNADSEPPSVSLSFANNFWGKDDAGVGPLLERMHNAKVTSDELKSFYAARAAIEEEYSRKLLNLSRKPLGSSESGTLKMSLDVVRAEVESMGKSHQNIAGQMKTELEEPLAAFAGGMKERRKIVQGGIEKLLKIKTQQTIAVNKARDRYEQDCLKIKGFLAQAHMVMGQEERKNKAKLEKTQAQLSTTSSEYEAAIKILEETTGRWNRDWKAACDKFQDLEEERIDYMKSSLWTFANIASTVCVSDDAACEKMRLSLEDCDVEKDITTFIKENQTGQEIPNPPKFINYCRGDTLEDGPEDIDEGNYSVAQFQRAMNPAFRTSSPQPSVFESHHDPNNPLVKELGLKDTKPIPLQEPVDSPVEPEPEPQEQQLQSMPHPRALQPGARSMAPQAQDAYSSRGGQPDPRMMESQPQTAHSSRGGQQDPRVMEPQSQIVNSSRRSQPDPRSMEQQCQFGQSSRRTQPDLRMVDQQHQTMQPPRALQPDPRPPRALQPDPRPPRALQPDPRPTSQQRASAQSTRSIQPDPRLIQAQQKATQQYQQNQVPHNDYPMDGMTQYCRVGAPMESSNIPSPVRPASRESVDHSDYSNPTSFSSIEPPSGSASPGKPMAQSPQPLDEKQVQKKKSGFFNSPFRRRAKDENEAPSPSAVAPASRNTWGPVSKQGSNNENVSPMRLTTRPFSKGPGGNILGEDARSASPEPVDPRANFQLNIGNNVFDVAPPDGRKKDQAQKNEQEELDPIAQALAELKTVTKQTSVRVSADRFHGLATPMPGTPNPSATPVGGIPTPLANSAVNAAQRGTPPPSYDQPSVSRLGAPKPAFTSRQMQQTTQRYVDQKTSMFNTREASRPTTSNTRPPTRSTGQSQETVPRATSPAPPRAKSPRPGLYSSQTPQATQAAPMNRSASPNPYAASNPGGRPRAQSRAQSTSPIKPPQPQYANAGGRGSVASNRGGSPGYTAMARAASPNPAATTPARAASRAAASTRAASPGPSTQFRQPAQSYTNRPASRAVSPAPPSQYRQSFDRPASRAVSPQPQFRQSYNERPTSSRGSDMAGMALQLAPTPGSERGEGSVYGGSQHGGSRPVASGRPMSQYAASEAGSYREDARARSKSLAEPRQYTKEGRMILDYYRAMYMYTAQIPEELSFAKGDILAVLRMQDDGWWEAEAVGKNGSRPGLVPSNYLQPI